MTDYTEADLARAEVEMRANGYWTSDRSVWIARLIASVREEERAKWSKWSKDGLEYRVQARAEGRRAGLEEAAAYHDNLAKAAKELSDDPVIDVKDRDVYWSQYREHSNNAHTLRALADKPAGQESQP